MKPNKKPKIGRPPGTTKTKKSLTLDDDLLALAEKMVSGKKFSSLSALVESAVRRLVESEKDEHPPDGGGYFKTEKTASPPILERYVNHPIGGREKKPQKRP